MQRDSETFRVRTLAAAAILFAGLAVGFLLGRMSAWLAAFEAPNRATVSRSSSDELGPSETVREKFPATTPASAPRSTTTAPAGIQPKATLKLPPPATSAPSGAASPIGQAAPDAASPVTQEPPKPVEAPNWRAATGDPANPANANDEADSRAPNVTLINPSHEDARAAAAEPATRSEAGMAEIEEVDRHGIAACERRYSSFRRNDGTYQPFGGGPRQRCPLLR